LARIVAEADLDIERVRAIRCRLMSAMESRERLDDVMSRFAILDRYERRATSRRNRAIRLMPLR
jgi:hypothetical protein